jgi:hypothetical protein
MLRIGLAACHRTGQAFKEAPPDGQAGQAVVKGRVRQAGLGAASGSVKKLQCSINHTGLPSAR